MEYALRLLAVLTLMVAFNPMALAEEDKPAPAVEEPAPEEKDPAVTAQEESIKKVYDMMNRIIQDLGPEEQKHFFMAYNNYNLIGTVKMVQGDVGKAVKSCGENNPDMKEKLDARYGAWNDAVKPVIKEADGNLGNMVLAQDYVKPKEMKAVFKAIDDTREKADDQIKKIPVTTPEACEYLLNKMDETQENMMNILRSTLVTLPQSLEEEPAAGDAPAEAAPAEAGKGDL